MENTKNVKKENNKDRFKFIWKYAKPYKFTILSGEICLISGYLFDVIKPLILAAIVDESFYHGNVYFFFRSLLLYLILFFGGSIFLLLYVFTWQRINNKFVLDIRIKMFEIILYAKASYLSNIKTGDVQTRINSDASQFMHIIQRNVFHTFNQLFSYVITIAMVYSINKIIAIFLFFMIPLTIIVTKYLGNKVQKISSESANRYGLLISKAYEFIKGMREIHLLNARVYVKKYIITSLSKLIRLDVKTSKIDFGIKKGNELINLVATLGLYILSAVMVFNGQLTVGYFIAIIEYFYSIQGNLNWMAENYIEWQKRKVYVDRVMEVMDIDTEKNEDRKDILNISKGKLTFKDVVFAYDEGQDVLKGISFEAQKGQKIALVGASGTGKSTITNLVLGFYHPQAGNILIDGKDIKSCTYKSLRKSIGVVQQDIQLFNESIRFNLLVGKSSASSEELWKALEIANIADLVKTLPDGLDTVIGSKGIGLSGGQKQRIIIARIFLKDPQILILDEATSALDFESEQLIRKAFEKISEGRTTIIIAHRLSTIINCEKVIVLNDSFIVSQGTHEELLKNCMYYKTLFEGQYLMKEA